MRNDDAEKLCDQWQSRGHAEFQICRRAILVIQFGEKRHNTQLIFWIETPGTKTRYIQGNIPRRVGNHFSERMPPRRATIIHPTVLAAAFLIFSVLIAESANDSQAFLPYSFSISFTQFHNFLFFFFDLLLYWIRITGKMQQNMCGGELW